MVVVLLDCYYLLLEGILRQLAVGHSTVAVPLPVVVASAYTAGYTYKHNIVVARSTAVLQQGSELQQQLVGQLAFAVDPMLLLLDSPLKPQGLHRAS